MEGWEVEGLLYGLLGLAAEYLQVADSQSSILARLRTPLTSIVIHLQEEVGTASESRES